MFCSEQHTIHGGEDIVAVLVGGGIGPAAKGGGESHLDKWKWFWSSKMNLLRFDDG